MRREVKYIIPNPFHAGIFLARAVRRFLGPNIPNEKWLKEYQFQLNAAHGQAPVAPVRKWEAEEEK